MTLTDLDLADVEARLRAVEDTVADLGDILTTTASSSGPSPSTTEPVYPTLAGWVAEWFAPTFARRLGAAHWCSTWWRHPEAVVRLEALWRSWEALRTDPALGLATWLREHLDPQRVVLFGEDGPFVACDGDAHHPPPPLPTVPPPAGWTPASPVSAPEEATTNE